MQTTATKRHRVDVRAGLVVLALFAASCTPGDSAPPPTSVDTTVAVRLSTTTNSTTTSTLPPPDTAARPTTTVPETLDPDVLTGIGMSSVPADVIQPTTPETLNVATNPINGRRGGIDRVGTDPDCAVATTTCVAEKLDQLGFDVTTGSTAQRMRAVERATAVVQLDAGLPMTGTVDDRLLDYLGINAPFAGADEIRRIGTSAGGRPIDAVRYGDGPRVVLVVGQTHGDEEGGLRVLLRVQQLRESLSRGTTLWIIPTMNPDGLVRDTRFLIGRADPNRHAPKEREQQAVYDFAISIRPTLTVWYHQNYGWVGASGTSADAAKQYQERTRLGTLRRSGDCVSGFMWCPIDSAVGSSSILVELPDVLTPADVQIHAQALTEVASA